MTTNPFTNQIPNHTSNRPRPPNILYIFKSVTLNLSTGDWLSEDAGAGWTAARANDTGEPLVTETKIDDWVPLVVATSDKPTAKNTSASPSDEASSTERKFIPLQVDQEAAAKPESEKQGRSIVFPYVYERKNDPRTRYIPLIPEEDLGIRRLHGER